MSIRCKPAPPHTPPLMLFLTMGLYSVAICAPTPSGSPSPQPMWLSAKQFIDARFANSVGVMMPQVREQLEATYPNARTDVAVINWKTAEFAIEAAGPPTVTYTASNWVPVQGSNVAAPISRSVAAEAFFNCTEHDETRKLTSSDVHTKELETTKTRSEQTTSRVKTSVKLETSASGKIGSYVEAKLGGELAKEWEKSVTSSTEFVSRTKETRVQTAGTDTDVTVPAMSIRFHEYVVRSDTERYIISAVAVVDVPVRAVFTRPEYTKHHFPGKTTFLAHKFIFDLGQWSYFVAPEERTIQQPGIVTIERETVVVGPVGVKFDNVDQCFTARKKLESNQTTVSDLVKAAKNFRPVPIGAQ